MLSNFRNNNFVSSWKTSFGCSVCKTTIFGINNGLRPSILQCYHDVCETCVKNCRPPCAITCKVCFQSTNIETTKPIWAALEPNFFLRGFMGYSNNALQQVIKSADAIEYNGVCDSSKSSEFDASDSFKCDECGIRSTQQYCQQCNVPLCSECFTIIHRAAKALKKHVFVRLHSSTAQIERRNPQVCEKHNKVCQQYCKVCQKITCEQCIPLDHGQHQHLVIALRDENTQYIKMLNGCVKKVINRQKGLEQLLKEKNEIFHTYENYAIETVNSLSCYFNKLHNVLQLAERNTLLQVKQNVIDFRKELDISEVKTKRVINNLESMVTSLKSYVKQTEKIHLKKIVDATEKFMEHTSTSITLPVIKTNPFVIDEIDELEKLLKELCPFKMNMESKQLQILSKASTSKEGPVKQEHPFALSIISTGNKKMHNDVEMHSGDCDVLGTESKTITDKPAGNVRIEKGRVSFYQNPTEFYVQFADNQSESIRKEIEIECAREGAINTTPNQIDTNHIYLFKNQGNVWHRCKVLHSHAKNQTYLIQLLETGEVLTASKQQIISVSDELRDKETGAKKCRIYDIAANDPKTEWSDESKIIAEKTILNKKVLVVVIKRTEQLLYVDLIATDYYGTSLRSALLFTDVVQQFTSKNKESINNVRYFSKYLKKILLTPLQNAFYPASVTELTDIRIHPLNIVSPSEFYVVHYDARADIEELTITLNNFYNTNLVRVYAPRINMKCAAKINGNWYRCRVIQLHEKLNVDVFLIDHGRTQTVDYAQLSYLDKSHCLTNEYAFRCSLIDVEPIATNNYEWSAEGLVEFKRIMNHSHLTVFVHFANHIHRKVSLKIVQKDRELNVNALLVKYGHAASTGIESTSVETAKTNYFLPPTPKKTCETQNTPSAANESSDNIRNMVEEFSKLMSTSDDQQQKHQQQLNSKNFEREEVVVAHIISPGEFYLHLTKDALGIQKLHSYIQKQREQQLRENVDRQMKSDWKSSDHCLAFVSISGSESDIREWYRAVVVDVSEATAPNLCPTYTVSLRDFGATVENVTASDLSEISGSDDRISNGAIKCHLACVKPTGGTDVWSGSAIDAFKSYVKRYTKIFATIQGRSTDNSIPIIVWGFQIEISDALAPSQYKYVNINKALNNSGFVELFEQFDRDKQIMKLTDVTSNNDFKDLDRLMEYIDQSLAAAESKGEANAESYESKDDHFDELVSDLEDDQQFEGWLSMSIDKNDFIGYVTYVDNEGNIYMHDSAEHNMLAKIKNYINEKFLPSASVENATNSWKIGQPCLARFHIDSLYYRAEVSEISEDGSIKVCFVDYGNIEVCTGDELNNQVCLTRIPRQACKYKLRGVTANTADGNWTEKVLDTMHSAIVTKMCTINVKSGSPNNADGIKECSIKVDGFDLAELLVAQELAKKIGKAKSDPKKEESEPHLLPSEEIASAKDLEDKDTQKQILKSRGLENTEIDKETIDLTNASSSDDEYEIWNQKKSVLKADADNKVDVMDVDNYKNMFQREELNKFVSSVLSVDSHTSDEVDINLICQYSTLDDCSEDPFSEIEERVNREPGKCFQKDTASSIESFDPVDTSTVITKFDFFEEFQFYRLPFGADAFYCEVNFIEKLTKFFISPQLVDLQKQYFEMMKNIQLYVKSSKSHSIELEEGKLCLAPFYEDNLYYRGVVRKVKNDIKKAEILYVDFFNTDEVPFSYIKNCPKQLTKYPLRLMPVHLHGSKPNPRWRENDIEATLHETLNEKKVFVEVLKPGRIPEVQFYDSSKRKKLILQDLYDKKLFLKT